MIIYHGSDLIIKEPKIIEPNRNLDFGGGFYLTSSKEQAQQWAFKVWYRQKSNKKIINIYEFDVESAKNELKIIFFDKPDINWFNFIKLNRSGEYKGDYDIVIGPVADDRIYKVIVEFENNIIDEETAIKRLNTEKLYDQLLFHSEKSLKFIKFVGWEEV